jgi:hypothetical protein
VTQLIGRSRNFVVVLFNKHCSVGHRRRGR